MSKRAFGSWLFALLFLGVALITTLLRLGLPILPDLSQQLLREVHSRSGVIVNAQRLRLDWQGRNLVIEADEIRATRETFNVSADNGYLQIDLWQSWVDRAPRLKRVVFDGLDILVPPARDASQPINIERILDSALAPLAMADRVYLTNSRVSSQNWTLNGINGVLAQVQMGARIDIDGQFSSDRLSGNLSLNLLAAGDSLQGTVDHQLRSSMDYLNQPRGLNLQGRAWINASKSGSTLDWIGQATAGPITVNGRAQLAEADTGGWLLETENLVLSAQEQRIEVGQIRAQFGAGQWALSTQGFDIVGVPDVLEDWMPNPLGQTLLAMQPQLTVLDSQWQGDTKGFKAWINTGAGQAKAHRNIPGGAFESATVTLDNWLGVASIQGMSQFHPASAYDQPLDLESGSGRIVWNRQQLRHWQLIADQVRLARNDLSVQGTFRSQLRPQNSTFALDLSFDSQSKPGQQWVPQRFLQDGGRSFWAKATPTFVVDQGQLNWNRRDQQNQIRLQADFSEASLLPLEGWPLVSDGRGSIQLEGGDIQITASQADFAGVSVSGQVLRDAGRWSLDVTGETDQVSQSLARLPLNLTALTDTLSIDGRVQANLDLTLTPELQGRIEVVPLDASVMIKPLALNLRDLSGPVSLDLKGRVQDSQIQATVWGQSAQIQLSQPNGELQVSAQANVPLKWATQRFAPPLTSGVSGNSLATLKWSPSEWFVNTQVSASQLNLPLPLNGVAADVSIQGSATGWQRMSAGPWVDLRLTDEQLSGRVGPTDLAGWANLVSQFPSGDRGDLKASLEIEQGRLGDLDLGPLALSYSNPQIQLDGPRLTAQITLGSPISVDAGAVVARVLNPDLPSDPTAAPRDLPDIDVSLKQLTLISGESQTDVYNLRTQMRAGQDQLRLNGLSLTLGGALMQGGAVWSTQGPQSSADLRISSQDIGELLEARGLGRPLETQSAQVDLTLDWIGFPWAPDFGSATGVVQLETGKGRILDGPGSADALRVFGILNVGSLTRRLRLDFSDLIQPGLAFDSITAQGRLRDGELNMIQPLVLDGPSARMLVSGSSNLESGNLDHQLKVQVPLSSQLPAAALLAGFPAIAAGIVLLVDQVAGENLKRIGETNYQISGTFEQPEINPIRVDSTP